MSSVYHCLCSFSLSLPPVALVGPLLADEGVQPETLLDVAGA